MPAIPQAAVLLAVAGMSVQIAGFSGLLAAFRRGGRWKPIDLYRLRQIPELGLATALIAVVYFPAADILGNAGNAVRLASGFALVFTAWHIGVLLFRGRRLQVWWASLTSRLVQILIDAGILLTAAVGVFTAAAGFFELVLVFMLARQIFAFVLVLADLVGGDESGP
jgi:hypothetical protein